MTELETIVHHLETNRLLHPNRSTDYLPRKDLQWLIDEVQRLRVGVAAQKRLIEDGDRWMREAKRLRWVLDRLNDAYDCPVCFRDDGGDHYDSCWFGQEMRRMSAATPTVLEQLSEVGGRLIVDKDGEV